MWLTIFAIAICAMIAISSQAKADIILPAEIQMHKVTSAAEIVDFTKQSSLEIVDHHCKSLLSPTKSEVMSNTISQNRRNVGFNGDLSIIKAIRSYRACAREVSLKELAKR